MANHMRFSRRQLVMTAAAALPVAAAQVSPPASVAAGDLLETARAEVRQRGEQLRKVKLPQLLEPSFVFRAW